MRISAVWYPVARWAEAKAFYGDVLGLDLTHCNDAAGWAAFATAGGPPLFLVLKPELAGSGCGAVVTLACPDLELLRGRLLEADARIEESPPDHEGLRVLTFYDPDGNCLEAVEAA